MASHPVTALDEARGALAEARRKAQDLVAYVKVLREKQRGLQTEVDEAIEVLSVMGYDEFGQSKQGGA